MQIKQFKGVALAMISSSTFGMIPLFALPVLHAGINTESVLFYRFGLSTVLLGIYLLIRREDLRVTMKEFATLFVLGVFFALTALFLTGSYLYLPSGIGTTIHFLYPVVVTGIMILFFKNKASVPVVLASLLAIAGVYLLSMNETAGAINLKGMGMVLVTVFTYAIYIVGVNKSCVHKMEGLKMTFFVLLSSSLVFLANLLLSGNELSAIPNVSVGINLFMLALLPTIVSDLALILAIQHVGSTTTAILGCMEPVTAVAVGVLLLNEQFGMSQIFGIVVIFLAVFLVILDSGGLLTSDNLKMLLPFRQAKLK
ncbi:MAG: EamA family transporter [Bacteroidales bacterium]